MYAYIIGKYIGISGDYVIIENNNIGYKIYTSGVTMASMPQNGEEVKLYLEQIVREDFIGLYGFSDLEELNMFKLLLGITGVGAKAALSLLSISRPQNLKYAIITEDEKQICRAPGIGKKTAGRIILELKDKFEKEKNTVDGSKEFDDDIQADNRVEEALSALISLGYSQKEAETAIKNANKQETVENIIKECLKILVG